MGSGTMRCAYLVVQTGCDVDCSSLSWMICWMCDRWFFFFFFFFCFFFFFFKQKTAYEIVSRDWSSDVCSSDLCIHPYQRMGFRLQFAHKQGHKTTGCHWVTERFIKIVGCHLDRPVHCGKTSQHRLQIGHGQCCRIPLAWDRKSTRLNSSHVKRSRMPSSAWKKKKKIKKKKKKKTKNKTKPLT